MNIISSDSKTIETALYLSNYLLFPRYRKLSLFQSRVQDSKKLYLNGHNTFCAFDLGLP